MTVSCYSEYIICYVTHTAEKMRSSDMQVLKVFRCTSSFQSQFSQHYIIRVQHANKSSADGLQKANATKETLIQSGNWDKMQIYKNKN